DPTYPVARTHQALVVSPGKAGGVLELTDKGVRRAAETEHGGGVPLTAGHVGRGVRRQLARVDRYLEATILEEPGGGEAHDPGTDDRGRPGIGMQRQVGGQRRASPGEGDPATSVAVVVNDGGVGEALRSHHEPRRPVGPQAGGGSDDAVQADRGEDERPNRRGSGQNARWGASRTPTRGEGGKGSERGAQHLPTADPSTSFLTLRRNHHLIDM